MVHYQLVIFFFVNYSLPITNWYHCYMAILSNHMLDFMTSSAEQTMRFGTRLGELMQVGDLVCLYGDLGAGKTTLARGIGRGWGTAVRVTSPTYVIVNEYPRTRNRETLYHIDAYRLDHPADAITAGLPDILMESAAWLIEWPEKIDKLLLPNRIDISLRTVSEFKRGLRIEAHGERPQEILDTFRRSVFGRS